MFTGESVRDEGGVVFASAHHDGRAPHAQNGPVVANDGDDVQDRRCVDRMSGLAEVADEVEAGAERRVFRNRLQQRAPAARIGVITCDGHDASDLIEPVSQSHGVDAVAFTPVTQVRGRGASTLEVGRRTNRDGRVGCRLIAALRGIEYADLGSSSAEARKRS